MQDVEQDFSRSSTVPSNSLGKSSVQWSGPITNIAPSKSQMEQQQGMQQEGQPQGTPIQNKQSLTAHTAYSITESGRKRNRQSSTMADSAAEAGMPHYDGALRRPGPLAEQPESMGHKMWGHQGTNPRSTTDVEGSWGDNPIAELPSSGNPLPDQHASPLSEHSGRAAAAAARAVSRVMALQAERSRLHSAIQVCGYVMHIPVTESYPWELYHLQIGIILLSYSFNAASAHECRTTMWSPEQTHHCRVSVR